MVKLILKENKIELAEYSVDATIQELSDAVELFRLHDTKLKTRSCKGCGECCNQPIPVLGLDLLKIQKTTGLTLNEILEKYIVLPQKPNIDARKSSIKDFIKMCDVSLTEAAALYEYNECEPLILPRKEDGTCVFLDNATGLCTIFGQVIRPFTCELYICTMGDELSITQEMIVRQGTWHAYYLLGWINKEEIFHNPFLNADNYDKVYIKDFEFNCKKAAEKLFFYF